MGSPVRVAIACLTNAAVILIPAHVAGQTKATPQGPLSVNVEIKRTLGPGISHSWQVSGEPGRFMVVEVENTNIDVMLQVRDASGSLYREIDGPGVHGIERVQLLTSGSAWTIEVVALAPLATGEYLIRWPVDRVPTRNDFAALQRDSLLTLSAQEYRKRTRSGHLKALELLTLALPLHRQTADRGGEALSLNNIGYFHQELARTDSALYYYELALPIHRETGDRHNEATTLHNIAFANQNLSRLDTALIYYAQALQLQTEIQDQLGLARTHTNLAGLYYDIGRLDLAINQSRQSLPGWRALGDRRGEATALGNIGQAYSELSQTDSAIAYLRQALPLRRTVGDHQGEAANLANIGQVHLDVGRGDSALTYFNESLLASRVAGDRRLEAATLVRVAAAFNHLGNADSALAYEAQSLMVARSIGNRAIEAMALDTRAITAQYVGGMPDLLRAVAYYDSAAAIRSSIASRTGGDENRVSYGEGGDRKVQRWALAWLGLHKSIGQRQSATAALAAAERGRAQSLLDLMRRSATESRSRLGAESMPTGPGTDMVALGQRLAQQSMAPGRNTLYYLVTRDTLIIWMIGPGTVEVFRRNVTREALESDVANLRHAIGADPAAARSRTLGGVADLEESKVGGVGIRRDIASVSRRLTGYLIPPELGKRLPAGELIIVPHGALNLLPFAMLPITDKGEPLGARYSIRYAPSLATLAELSPSPTSGGVKSTNVDAIVIGNPAMPRVRTPDGVYIKLAPLPGAALEGISVAAQLGATLTEGEAATEAEVKRRLPGARLVHLATHGYAYAGAARARDSFIALAPTPEEDGLLTVREVLDELPQLIAELIVLSACQTGLGDLKQAEGTVGLQRAFLAKGARSVLVSLWSVSDEATQMLMQSFYTHWLAGNNKAEAVRKAQIDVRGAPGSRFYHPRFWAAFQLVGS